MTSIREVVRHTLHRAQAAIQQRAEQARRLDQATQLSPLVLSNLQTIAPKHVLVSQNGVTFDMQSVVSAHLETFGRNLRQHVDTARQHRQNGDTAWIGGALDTLARDHSQHANEHEAVQAYHAFSHEHHHHDPIREVRTILRNPDAHSGDINRRVEHLISLATQKPQPEDAATVAMISRISSGNLKADKPENQLHVTSLDQMTTVALINVLYEKFGPGSSAPTTEPDLSLYNQLAAIVGIHAAEFDQRHGFAFGRRKTTSQRFAEQGGDMTVMGSVLETITRNAQKYIESVAAKPAKAA